MTNLDASLYILNKEYSGLSACSVLSAWLCKDEIAGGDSSWDPSKMAVALSREDYDRNVDLVVELADNYCARFAGMSLSDVVKLDDSPEIITWTISSSRRRKAMAKATFPTVDKTK